MAVAPVASNPLPILYRKMHLFLRYIFVSENLMGCEVAEKVARPFRAYATGSPLSLC
jgi:hypothetical protein